MISRGLPFVNQHKIITLLREQKMKSIAEIKRSIAVGDIKLAQDNFRKIESKELGTKQ